MFIDASAIIAILVAEEDGAALTAQRSLDRFIEQIRTRVISITPEIGRSALAVFERYGRGRHPAALNMGDCFAYAGARSLHVPLLYKGNDFPQTDIPSG